MKSLVRCTYFGFAGFLVAMLWSAGARAQIANPHRLPPSKQNIERCRSAALALKPGTVEKFRIIWEKDTYWFQFDIQSHEESESKVFCDGASGEILQMKPDATAVAQ